MTERLFGRHAGFGVRGVLSAFIATVAVAASPAMAVDLTVVNPGFEDITGESPFNEFTFGPLNGWDLYDPTAVTGGGAGPTFFIGTLTPTDPAPPPTGVEFFPAGAPEGERVGIAFKYFEGGAGEFGLVQTLTDVLAPNTNYALSVLIGNIASGTSVSTDFFPLDGFPGYRVDLLAGGVVIASDNNSLAGTIPDGEWALSTVQFTTGSSHAQLGQALGIRLVNLNVDDPEFPGQDLEVDFDAVALSATVVPEPTCAMLAGACLLPLYSRSRSRRRI